MIAFPVEHTKHGVVESSHTRYLRRVLRDPNLCTIFHFPTGNWIIARWLDHSRSSFMELGLLEPPFSPEQWEKEVERIRLQLSGDGMDFLQEMQEAARLGERHGANRAQDEHDDELDRMEFLRKNSHLTRRDHPLWMCV